MSLEAIKQVTEAEQLHKQHRAEAVAEAKRTVAEAERAGKARLAELQELDCQVDFRIHVFQKEA